MNGIQKKGFDTNRWKTCYELIRQANIFLEYATKPIVGEGVGADRIDEELLKWYRANVRFMRAYYHFLLFELYGPVPIVTESITLEDKLQTARNSVDEVIEFIDSEILEAMKGMHDPEHDNESYRAVPTKGAALAVRARLWIYAASPLFNGEYTEALQLKNPDGKALFPAKDEKKWQKAVDACKDLIDYAEQGHFELYKAYDSNGKIDPAQSTYNVFQEYNPEMIWATSRNSWGGMDNDQFDRWVTPRSERNGSGMLAVYQELVDDFFMKDGLPIKTTSFLPQSPLYSETGFSDMDGLPVHNMYHNREARFYNTITFNNKRWQISDNPVEFFLGGNADRSTEFYPLTGYLLYKRMNKTIHKNAPGVASKFRPVILYRLAEFYLLYAEALNEVTPTHPDILKYTNLVRERAGLPKLEDLNPSIRGNQAMQREAIRRESRVELCTEGQRYFDVRRWMIAENAPGEGGLGGRFTGMNMEGDLEKFHTRTGVLTRTFPRKNYLFPIYYNEIENSLGELVQNPGW